MWVREQVRESKKGKEKKKSFKSWKRNDKKAAAPNMRITFFSQKKKLNEQKKEKKIESKWNKNSTSILLSTLDIQWKKILSSL